MDLRELRAGLDPLRSPFTPGPAFLEVGSARAQATVGNSTAAAELRMVRPRVSVALFLLVPCLGCGGVGGTHLQSTSLRWLLGLSCPVLPLELGPSPRL